MISTFLFSLYFLVLFYNIRYAFLLLIFFNPLLPKYMNIELSIGNVYISYQTAMLGILLLVTILLIFSGQLKIKDITIFNKQKIGLLLLLFFFIKLVATILYSTDISGGIVSIVYYMLDSIIILILASIYISNDKMLNRLLYTLLISYIFVILIAYIEKLYGQNIFMEFIDLRYDFYSDIISGNIRNEEYRLMASFQNTLILTAYLTVLLPIMTAVVKIKKSYNVKIFQYILVIFTLLVIYWTYSRTGYFLIGLLIGMNILILFYRTISFRAKSVALKIIIVLIVMTILLLINNFNVIVESMINSSEDKSEQSSIISRYNQFTTTYEVIEHSLFLGNGSARSILSANEELQTIDNFYLRLFIESGLLGLSIFITILFLTYRAGISTLKKKLIVKDALILQASLLSLTLMLVDLALTSIPDHHIFLYIIIYIIIYLNMKYNDNSKKLNQKALL